MSLNLKGHSIIAGKSSGEGNMRFNSINPRTDEAIPPIIVETTPSEIGQAARSAESAFFITRTFSDESISQFLSAVAENIRNLGEDLLKICDMETGLGHSRLLSERERTCNQLEMFAEYVKKGDYRHIIINHSAVKQDPEYPNAISQADLRKNLIPIGPVAVFGASNFPFAFGILGGDTVSAWAARCPVLAKSHPSHPLTSELLTRAVYIAIEKCHFPSGFFSLIQGASIEVGTHLVGHPVIKAAAFTGSFIGGKAIYDIAVRRRIPIPVYSEMGSFNPVFLHPSVFAISEQIGTQMDRIIKKLVGSVTLSMGQFCTKPGVIFIPPFHERPEFIHRFNKVIQDVMPLPLLNRNVYNRIKQKITDLRELRNIRLYAHDPDKLHPNECPPGIYEVNFNEFLRTPELHFELFGPIAVLVSCEGIDDYIKAAEVIEGQLTGTIFYESGAEEDPKLASLIEKLQYKVGRLIFNGVPTGVEVVPAMHHGGPFPATTSCQFTSVGTDAIYRFLRPVTYQNCPPDLLPDEIRDENIQKYISYVDGMYFKSQ